MAIHHELPVYRASYDLLVEIFKLTRNFDREFKYTLGESMKNEIIEMMTNIYRANCALTKTKLIQDARENLEVNRLYLRLLKDLKQISLPRFIALNENIESVSKQLTAWHKTSSKMA